MIFCFAGSPALDQILTVLLSTSMFVGGLAGFVLDNTIPGIIIIIIIIRIVAVIIAITNIIIIF